MSVRDIPLAFTGLGIALFALGGLSACSSDSFENQREANQGSTGGAGLQAGTGGAASGGGSPSGTGGDSAMSGGASSGGAAASGGQSGTGGSIEGSGGETAATGPTLPPSDDYSQKGPFETKVDMNVGPNGGYTVFRPEPMDATPFDDQEFLYAPIIFGPGIGQNPGQHTEMLTNFASHGFVVVGTPVLNQGPGGAENRQKLLDGLTWILAQNETPGIYQGKLWVDHVVSMGFSVGGTSAVEIGGEPSVATVVSIHGHTAEADLHGTMLQTSGTLDNIGLPLQEATYAKSMVPTFLATLDGAPHSYIDSNGGGDERPAIVAWLRYWIYSDQNAENWFFGDDCKLCQAPWTNPQRKNWD